MRPRSERVKILQTFPMRFPQQSLTTSVYYTFSETNLQNHVSHINEKRRNHNWPFYNCVLSCQAFDLGEAESDLIVIRTSIWLA